MERRRLRSGRSYGPAERMAVTAPARICPRHLKFRIEHSRRCKRKNTNGFARRAAMITARTWLEDRRPQPPAALWQSLISARPAIGKRHHSPPVCNGANLSSGSATFTPLQDCSRQKRDSAPSSGMRLLKRSWPRWTVFHCQSHLRQIPLLPRRQVPSFSQAAGISTYHHSQPIAQGDRRP